jgi:pimeloyl-ACP methyl ester carboxylesterase
VNQPLGLIFVNALALVLLALSGQAKADDDSWFSRCEKFRTPVKGAFCIHNQPFTGSDDVLYYFIGRGSNERTWFESEGIELRRAWEKSGARTPTVVTIVLGSWFLLTDRNKDGSRGLFPMFVEDILPKIEAKLGGVRGRRLLTGSSMGGFNASQLLLKRPDLWSRAALLCPAILAVSPYSTLDESFDYMKRSGAGPFSTWLFQAFFRGWFASEKDWHEVSPLEIAESKLGPDTPPLFVSAGEQDHYGFHLGGELFAELARHRSQNEVEWKSVPGNHCSFDSVELGAFLVR